MLCGKVLPGKQMRIALQGLAISRRFEQLTIPRNRLCRRRRQPGRKFGTSRAYLSKRMATQVYVSYCYL